MELHDARVLLAGPGAVGAALAGQRAADGARLHLAGRDTARLEEVGGPLGAAWSRLEITDPASVRDVVEDAAAALGGLDAVVVCTGVPAFGAAEAHDPQVHRELMAVDAIGPMDLLAAALPHLGPGGAVVAITAILADHPTAGMAAYSGAKAALSAYLTALRREVRRRRITVLDVRPPHLGTAFGDRALAGSAPEMAAAVGVDELAATVLGALRDDRPTVTWDLRGRALVVG
jgi:NAD(P)-dependent dehydrogenase (short-subunit alcohol dehydrogenase family)